jgi:hypothetical protein
MKKRTKRYQRKRINPNAAFNAINLSKPVSDNAKSQLAIGINVALDAFAKGYAQKNHFDTLASTVDLAMMLSNTLFDGAYMAEINLARDAMIRCRERFVETAKLRFDGEGYNAVKFAIQLHDEQLNHVTGAEVMQMMEKRAQHIRSGNYFKGRSEDLRVAA